MRDIQLGAEFKRRAIEVLDRPAPLAEPPPAMVSEPRKDPAFAKQLDGGPGTQAPGARLALRRLGGFAMADAIWNLGAVSIGSGVLTVLASLGFAVYLVLVGPERPRQ
jgi:hypothetical protein